MSNSSWSHELYSPWNSPSQNTWVGSLSLLQEIFPTQGLNPGLLHCRWIIYQLTHKGSPRILKWVAYPFSSGSSWPRNQTRASCIACRFFTNWAIREAHLYITSGLVTNPFNLRWQWRFSKTNGTAAAAAKSLKSCLTLCDHIDGSPPGSPILGILQARTLEWVVISFSNAWKWKVKVKSLSCVWLLSIPWTAAHQAPPPMGFSRQEYWRGIPLPSLKQMVQMNLFTKQKSSDRCRK